MKYDSYIHHRQSTRLHDYDYSQPGYYFVTICTFRKECIFGIIKNGEMQLNDAGRIAELCWREIPVHYPKSNIDVFIIMPNHVHGIIILQNCDNVGANNYSPLQTHGTSKTIGAIIRGYKIGVTKWFRENDDSRIVWQRNYYDHVIRDEISLRKIREYIIVNPAMWDSDEENPANI